MRDLKIVFMGTPDFAVATLQALVENNYTIVGVITAPDKPAGRGRKLNESAVKKYAKSQDLTVLQPTNLKSDSFLEALKGLHANLHIVVAFRMLPKVVWQMPEYGTFNLHASLLPNYRGAAPINWAIINGETKTGVSTFFIDDKIDTGDMILQETIDIDPNEHAGSLHDKLMAIGSQLVLKTVNAIQKGKVKTIPQKETQDIKTAYKLNKDNCKINWDDSIKNMHLISALLYRPVIKEDGDDYEIEKHKTQGFMKRSDIFLNEVSISTVYGSLLFFSASGINFCEIMADYLEEEAKIVTRKEKRAATRKKKATTQSPSKKSK